MSLPRADGRYYNRFYFVQAPTADYATYDKRHLFSFAGEDKRYTAGTERVVVEHYGFRILLQVCYDLRFPVFARNRGDYDMILYVANWPTVRISAWNALLRARAVENQCYVAGVNRTGDDPALVYDGSSALIGFLGETVAAATPGREEAVQGEADLKALEAFRAKFPALRDARCFYFNRIMKDKLLILGDQAVALGARMQGFRACTPIPAHLPLKSLNTSKVSPGPGPGSILRLVHERKDGYGSRSGGLLHR